MIAYCSARLLTPRTPAQIVGIVDVYDALTTARPYRKAMTAEAGMAEITRCRSWWSDRVYIAFVEALTAGLHNPAPLAL